jgi:murein DD-endopeptidase MepM/ murein hydrolase activator NlpD
MTRLRTAAFFIFVLVVVALAAVLRPEEPGLIAGDEALIPLAAASSPSPPASPAPALASGTPAPAVPTLVQPLALTPTPPSAYAGDLIPQGTTPLASPESTQTNGDGWTPLSLPVPLARHPNDHFWFVRPIAPDATNTGLDWYPYGTDGETDGFLTHLGIDIPNPVGIEVRAAGSGVVIWAGLGHQNEHESISAYGNTVVIEHDFGYNGEKVYTLYAHLSAILVQAGDSVPQGELIGLIGETGQVTGPHVHFEVRVGTNAYFSVRNPDLWIAPYVGTGVIAGRLTYQDGTPAYDALITIRDLSTGDTTYQTHSYARPEVKTDDRWDETFAIPNVGVGRYVVLAESASTRWTGEVEVLEGMTNWVTMALYRPEG